MQSTRKQNPRYRLLWHRLAWRRRITRSSGTMAWVMAMIREIMKEVRQSWRRQTHRATNGRARQIAALRRQVASGHRDTYANIRGTKQVDLRTVIEPTGIGSSNYQRQP